MTRRKRCAEKAQSKATCRVCHWSANEPPGACCTPGCGLRNQIHAARNATRARLGLPTLAPAHAHALENGGKNG